MDLTRDRSRMDFFLRRKARAVPLPTSSGELAPQSAEGEASHMPSLATSSRRALPPVHGQEASRMAVGPTFTEAVDIGVPSAAVLANESRHIMVACSRGDGGAAEELPCVPTSGSRSPSVLHDGETTVNPISVVCLVCVPGNLRRPHGMCDEELHSTLCFICATASHFGCSKPCKPLSPVPLPALVLLTP